MVFKKIFAFFIRPRICCVCGAKTDFCIYFEYKIDKNLNVHDRKCFCVLHGLEEWRRKIENFPGQIIFVESGLSQTSGSFFYAPQDLAIHDYNDEDKEQLEEFFKKLSGNSNESAIGWFPYDVVGDMTTAPLFKITDIVPENISVSELITRLRNCLKQIEFKNKKGQYHITEPRANKGIYIWQGDI